MRRLIISLLLALWAWPAAAQAIVESDRIDSISVTLYRDPNRNEGAIRRGWPGGYALITETRTFSVPAGESVIRFVGVSQGMLPESAIVTGLPRGVKEKNRDARLLSPAALVDAYLKRSVTVRRTNRATGKVTTVEGVIEAGPGGGVVLSTAEGVVALGCSGLPEGLTYPKVPADLSAKPTLSVITQSTAPATVTVQLSYIAQGLDWSANYVARVAENGETLDLFAWLTVVNGGSQGFAGARTNAVAGAPNKEAAAALPTPAAPDLQLQCWPTDITSTHPSWGIDRGMPEALPAPMAVAGYADSDIVVTAQRRSAKMQDVPMAVSAVMVAQQEELGDLKLYRVPEPVTVAAQSQKQVAMITQPNVKFERIYTGSFEQFDYDPATIQRGSHEAGRVLRTENLKAKGLGVALPAGGVVVFEQARGESLLVGESDLSDRAVGEEVELATGTSTDVRYEVTARPPSGRREPYEVEVTNARSTPEMFEFVIPYKVASSSAKLVERKGRKAWRVTVPANGTAKLSFALKLEAEN